MAEAVMAVDPGVLVNRYLREINRDKSKNRKYRDLHLKCKDGLVTWSCLFLAPVVSDDLWGAIAELNSCQRCSRSGATVLLLPDFELETAMSFLGLLTTGEARASSAEDLSKLCDLLRALGVDLQKPKLGGRERKTGEQEQEVIQVEDEEGGGNTAGDPLGIAIEVVETVSQNSEEPQQAVASHPSAAGAPEEHAAEQEVGDEILNVMEEEDSAPPPSTYASAAPQSSTFTSTASFATAATSSPTSYYYSMKSPMFSDARHRCPHCGDECGSRPHLLAHLSAAHYQEELVQEYAAAAATNGKGNLVCPSCPRAFKKASSLARHVGTFHRKVLEVMPEADAIRIKKMSSGTTAVRCWLKKKGERRRVSFQCPMCERRLPLKSLLSHISGSHVFAELKSLVKRKFPVAVSSVCCHLCGRSPQTKTGLFLHYGSVHGMALEVVREVDRRALEAMGARRDQEKEEQFE